MTRIVTVLLAVLAAVGALAAAPVSGPGHIRVVWCQDQGSNDDVFGDGSQLQLMAYDSEDGKGERVVLKELRNCNKPLLSPRADRIFFTDRSSKPYQAWVINWDGSDLRHLGDGQALATWSDPQTGLEWVYIQRGPAEDKGGDANAVYRHRIDNFSISEQAWDAAPVSRDNFQLSADGRRAGGQFPWPRAGVADLAAGTWQATGRGCWTSFAPDNSYMSWLFDGSHRHLSMLSGDRQKSWNVEVNGAPGMDGAEVYHPRWSNHARYFVLTGPYRIRKGSNNIRGGGPGVEIHIGRFNESFSAVDEWIQVTRNDRADFFPDLWVANVAPAAAAETPTAAGTPKGGSDWPVRRDHLAFLWENDISPNEVAAEDAPPRTCTAVPRGRARYGRFRDMLLGGGWFSTEGEETYLLEHCWAGNGLTIEALMTPDHLMQTGTTAIICFGESLDTCNFALVQTDNRLSFRLLTVDETTSEVRHDLELHTFSNAVPWRIMVSYKPGKLNIYINGRRVHQINSVTGGFRTWLPARLTFGGTADGKANWAGRLEGIAIHNAYLGDRIARQSHRGFAARLAKRRGAERVEVTAVLREVTATPDLQAIAPYRRALVVYAYDVTGKPDGQPDSDSILVAHWGLLDGENVIAERTPGETYRLVLERFEDHPELESERLLMDTEDLTSPMFFDVGP